MGTADAAYAIMSMLFLVGIVMFLAYITTRYVGINSSKRFKNKNFQIIEVMPLSFQKYLYIVRATDQYLLLSVTKDDIRLVSTIEKDKTIVSNDDALIGQDFKKLLDGFMGKPGSQGARRPGKR